MPSHGRCSAGRRCLRGQHGVQGGRPHHGEVVPHASNAKREEVSGWVVDLLSAHNHYRIWSAF